MLKRLFIFILLTPLLFNGVWATVHSDEEHHDSHDRPHIHLDVEHHHPSITSASSHEVFDEPVDQDIHEHDAHEHVHLYLNVFIKTDDMNHSRKRETTSLFGFNSQFTSLLPTPPTPPANIYL